MQLLVIVRVAEVSPQLMDAVRVEREQVRSVGGIALALQVEHAQALALPLETGSGLRTFERAAQRARVERATCLAAPVHSRARVKRKDTMKLVRYGSLILSIDSPPRRARPILEMSTPLTHKPTLARVSRLDAGCHGTGLAQTCGSQHRA